MSTNELLLLGLLGRHRMHGYELHETLERKLSFLSDLKKPTAYRLLETLHRQGLVEREVERAGRRPERRVYRLTAKGRARFDELLRAELEAPAFPVDPGNVALVFADQLLPGGAFGARRPSPGQLEARRDVLRDLVARHSPRTSARLVLEHDLAHVEAEIAWLSSSLAAIKPTSRVQLRQITSKRSAGPESRALARLVSHWRPESGPDRTICRKESNGCRLNSTRSSALS